MKDLFKSSRFKLIVSIIALLLVGMFICAANGHGETAQSGIVGTIFSIALCTFAYMVNSIAYFACNPMRRSEYCAYYAALRRFAVAVSSTNEHTYKDALGLKEEHKDFKFAEASVIGRDSANPYCSFTVSKGTLNGVKDGAAVLYGKYLIGVIKKAYPTYSVVNTILDPDFSVSAYDISTNEQALFRATQALQSRVFANLKTFHHQVKFLTVRLLRRQV